MEETLIIENMDIIHRHAYFHTNIKHLIIKNVKIIDVEAFHGCNKLETIEFHEGLQEIRSRAFWYCSSLKEVVFPKSIQLIGSRAFECCSHLEKIKLLYPGTFIDEYAFNETPYWHNLLKQASLCISQNKADCYPELVLPEGVMHVDIWAYNKSAIEYLYLPNSLRTIGNCAFKDCIYLKEISMSPNTYCNTKMKLHYTDGIFSGCQSLEKVIFRGLLKPHRIFLEGFDEEKTFMGCYKLKQMIGWEIPLSFYPSSWKKYAIDGYLEDIDRNNHYRQDVQTSYDDYLHDHYEIYIQKAMHTQSYAIHQYLTHHRLIDEQHISSLLETATKHQNADIIALLLEYQNTYLTHDAFTQMIDAFLQED
ncbi:MAG: leucine-rich repeat domain-containing protein [Erysipelotrichaceae bacterium]|nr:leucine-rich repeat domain-containing protein [Erysipelotrichaceae bacterium]